MSTLKVNNIDTQTGTTISVASGKVLTAPGHVIQTIYSSITSPETTTSTSYVNTSLAATITPTSSSSKILVMVNAAMYATGVGTHAIAGIFRGDVSGTDLGNGTYGIGSAYTGSGGAAIKAYVCCAILDSPNTTSATTYTVAIKKSGGSYSSQISVNSERSTIALQEIAQ
jgi:hypothetical protein